MSHAQEWTTVIENKKVIPITQEEMCDLLDKILIVCQRSKSIIAENMDIDGLSPENGDIEAYIADLMHPHLFPVGNHINLVEAIMKTMDNHRVIEPINIYNILIMVEREIIIYPNFKRMFPTTYIPTASEYLRAYSEIKKREKVENGIGSISK